MNHLTENAVRYRWTAVLNGVVLLLAISMLCLSPAAAAPEQQQSAQKLSASAIQVIRTQPSEGLTIPEDFRAATYEHLIDELEKTKKFQKVYRDGDRTAASVPDLVTVKLTPEAFKEGSQKKREVTTVSGATSLKINVQFVSKDGKVLLEKSVEGKVRFFGENLGATKDFAKKVAAAVNESF